MLIINFVYRFQSSNDSSEQTSLQAYIDRMKEKQEHIYFIAGSSRSEVGFSGIVISLVKWCNSDNFILCVMYQ